MKASKAFEAFAGDKALIKLNANCKCPNNKCPNHGNCKDCNLYHHKGLHTYCKAGKLEKFIRNIHAKQTN